MKRTISFCGCFTISLSLFSRAQGFTNLDFESANIPAGTPIGSVNASEAIPGWSVFLNEQLSTTVRYDGRNIDLWDVEIEDAKSTYPPLVGSYGLLMQGGRDQFGNMGTAVIAQVGTIDPNSHSMLFAARFSGAPPAGVTLDISFKGQSLPIYALYTGPSFTRYGVDVSPFAGQTGELRVTTPYGISGLFFDEIQFSSQVIPEPTTLTLLAAGAAIFATAFARRRQSS